MTQQILVPILVLVAWTLIVWVWMYAKRLPAMKAAGIKPDDAREKSVLNAALPLSVRQVADNYNHLMEQPTLFYALLIAVALLGLGDPLNLQLAWAYVALRIVHSLIQCTINRIALRFSVFALATFCLMAITLRSLWMLFG
jgi:hypothetical protein